MVFGNIFTTLIVQPMFNLLALIYNIIPGHDFGMAIILFTILVRLALWPLIKKQLHHTKAMRALQPELKKIKQAAAGDRRKEQKMIMELYKEREINPFATVGILIVQAPILIGLYAGLNKLVHHPDTIVNFSYSFLHFGWIQTLSHDITKFEPTLFSWVNLTKMANGPGGIYWPAMVLVLASAITQYLQSKQLMPAPEKSRGLRAILKEAGGGKQSDQQEVSAAVGRSTLFLIPFLIILVGIHLPAAIALYMLVSSSVAYIQQSIILKGDVEEAEAVVVSTRTIGDDEMRKLSVGQTSTSAGKKSRKTRRRRR
jgi:YidC/Oxa1 family membrane protein insertase